MPKPLRHKIDRRKFRTKLLIEEHEEAIGEEYGNRLKRWLFKNQWVMGHVEHLRGREVEFARRMVASATSRIHTPYIPFITRRHRFINARTGAVYEIGDINDVDDLGIEQIFTVTERPREKSCNDSTATTS